MTRFAFLIWTGLVWFIPSVGQADGIINSDLTENGVREIRGQLGNARYQIAIPLAGNGRTILYVSPYYFGDENSNETFLKPLALARGWVYVASNEGDDLMSVLRDRWYEVRRGILNLVAMSKDVSRAQYGRDSERTYIAGWSLGGQRTKWMLENTNAFDGGLSLSGSTSWFETLRWITFYARNYDGTPESVGTFAAQVSGFQFDAGLKPSYGPPLEQERMRTLAPLFRTGAIQRYSPAYPGDPALWDPDVDIPLARVEDLRHYDETGWLKSGSRKTPLILLHGGSDAIVSPACSIAYLELVKQILGAANAHDILRVFIIPGFTHFHFFKNGPANDMATGLKVTDEALTALDKWVNAGEAPDSIAGIAPLQ
jgi:hypothetical protein